MRCKVERHILAWLLGLVTLLGIPRAGSASDDEDEFILRCSPEAVQEVVRRHGLTLIHSHESQDIHFVRAPATAHPEHFLSNLRSDPDVQGIEADTDVMFPEARPGLKVDQSTASILDTLSHRTLVPFYGSRVLSSYVDQPAVVLIGSPEAHQLATGAGIVAVIDTGVDPNHPVLKPRWSRALTSPATCLAYPRSSPIWASPPRPFWTNPRPPSWTNRQSSS